MTVLILRKTGLKAAEQVLRKNPNHADTQAMKALIISNQGQQKEAFALAKTALNNNMKSHVCWHVYGLLYRAEKNFDESIKAYKFALRLDPESAPIQRDLAHLQIQMRDYQGYIQSRRNMLQQKPGFRQNWTALAIAHHLAGNMEDAENVLTTYEDTLKQKPTRADMEHWEAVLYKNYIIAESGEYEKALEHLEAVGKKSPDVLGVMEMRADYLLKIGRKADAENAYAALLDRNPDSTAYYDGLISSKGFGSGDEAAMRELYGLWATKFPRSDLPRRRPLDFLNRDAFRNAADAYLQRMLRKGVPSTFANIKHLYSDASKLQIVEDLAHNYASGGIQLQMNGSADPSSTDGASRFRPSALYFLAQHYNHHLSRDLPKALKFIDEALELDPNSVDFHQTKARTLKYFGALPEAMEVMEKARSLDERDRAINTKCAKYQLRNDQNEKALETMSKFTRNETAGGPLGDLHDMQCIWYLTEDGESYLRQRKLGLALKRFHAAFNVFDIWQEDQFDFHNFSLRKGMIRAYIDMLRWEDRLRDHPFYAKIAIPAVRSYILLHDSPDLVHGPLPNGINGGEDDSANAAERKKAIKKAKKEQQKLEKAEADKKEALKTSKGNAKSADGEAKKDDPDPLGKTLVETKEPLQDAMKFLTPLLDLDPENIEAQTVGFEVYIRRGKSLLFYFQLSSSLTFK
jgi:N-alpha-acetyltransferase 15/16, NatA auxiliary subunit